MPASNLRVPADRVGPRPDRAVVAAVCAAGHYECARKPAHNPPGTSADGMRDSAVVGANDGRGRDP